MDGRKMSTKFEEKISALVDNELTSFESRRVIDELEADSALKRRWERYHLMGDLLRDEVPAGLDRSFTASVMERINNETVSNVTPTRTNVWLKPAAGFAIVATVAIVSLFSLKSLTSVSPPQAVAVESLQPTQAAVSSATPASSGMVQPVSIERTASSDSGGKVELLKPAALSDDPRMNDYLATHAEFAARQGIVPRVRVLGFEAGEK
jgi:sigma-E factor negative regulatory protein RseA